MLSKAESLKPWTLYRRMEGGAVYTADRDNKFYVIVNQVALVGLLSDDEAVGIAPLAVHVFLSDEDRRDFLLERFSRDRD